MNHTKKPSYKQKVQGTQHRPRVVFCESNRYLRVQAIDDENSHTLVAASTEELLKDNDYSAKNKQYASDLAVIFADRMREAGYSSAVFDRNHKRYQGKVKVFCDSVRAKGIIF